MKDEKVFLVEHNQLWSAEFAKEKRLIEKTIGPWIFGGVHHVGSTAIPDILAKPVIDIMVGVKDLKKAKQCIEPLEKIHYCYYPYKPDQMMWFCKPSPEHRTHHLYLMEPSHPEWSARLAFRDYLRNHPEEREKYQNLKLDLAIKYKNDREAYTQAKAEFVKRIVAKAQTTL